MCTELILAIIYFFTIAFVNYFLFQLLQSYKKSIFSFLRIKNLFQNYSNEVALERIILLLKIEKENKILIPSFSSFALKDSVLIGNLYKYLRQNDRKKQENYYFYLMEKQFLNEKKWATWESNPEQTS